MNRGRPGLKGSAVQRGKAIRGLGVLAGRALSGGLRGAIREGFLEVASDQSVGPRRMGPGRHVPKTPIPSLLTFLSPGSAGGRHCQAPSWNS